MHNRLIGEHNVEQFEQWCGFARTHVAFDIETTGLEWDCKVRLVQFGDVVDGWAIPFEGNESLVQQTLDRFRGCLVAHNSKFDLSRLINAGIRVPEIVDDTLVLFHVIDPTQPLALKDLAAKLLGVQAKDSQTELRKVFRGPSLADLVKQIRSENTGLTIKEADLIAREIQPTLQYDWATIPIDNHEYIEYGIQDTVLTARLFQCGKGQCGLGEWNVYQRELQAQAVLQAMEAKGLLVDQQYTSLLRDNWQNQINNRHEHIVTTYGVSNPNARRGIIARLLDDGWRPTEWTPTGEPKLDEKVLATVDHPLAEELTEYKRLVKWKSSYLDAFMEKQDKKGRIHPSINGVRARTGRMSVVQPALQTLPKSDPTIRRCFRAAPGKTLVSVDYDQVELRIAASLAGEDAMLEAIKAGEDLHTVTAQKVFKKEQVSKEERQLAKNSNFLTIYGGGAKKLAATAGVSEVFAKDFLTDYFRVYPSLKRFLKENQAQAQRYGFVSTHLWGRKIPVDAQKPYAATNYLVQGSAAEVLKDALLRLAQSVWGASLLLPIHDEVLFEVETRESSTLLRETADIMTDNRFPGVTLTASGDLLGTYWGIQSEVASLTG